MKLTQPFNRLTFAEYTNILDRNTKYSNFNMLGLFRSILENNKLELTQKLELKEIIIVKFPKFYNFLQIKDPFVYAELQLLGQSDVTVADRDRLWQDITTNQQKILAAKKIKHRNFGIYSKHNCGDVHCPYNGLMTKRGCPLSGGSLIFKKDEHTYMKELKSDRQRKEKRDFRDKVSQLELDRA